MTIQKKNIPNKISKRLPLDITSLFTNGGISTFKKAMLVTQYTDHAYSI